LVEREGAVRLFLAVMAGLDPIGAKLRGKSGLRDTLAVMAGLDPAIQPRNSLEKPRAFNKALFRDGRVKPGHDKAAALILAPMRLVPAIHVTVSLFFREPPGVDARHKAGHDGKVGDEPPSPLQLRDHARDVAHAPMLGDTAVANAEDVA
jgi:hypothetical protein